MEHFLAYDRQQYDNLSILICPYTMTLISKDPLVACFDLRSVWLSLRSDVGIKVSQYISSVLEIPTGPPVRGRQLWRRTGNFLLIFLQYYVYDLRFKPWGPITFLTEFQTLHIVLLRNFFHMMYHIVSLIWYPAWLFGTKPLTYPVIADHQEDP